jgi:hypothetical protein
LPERLQEALEPDDVATAHRPSAVRAPPEARTLYQPNSVLVTCGGQDTGVAVQPLVDEHFEDHTLAKC